MTLFKTKSDIIMQKVKDSKIVQDKGFTKSLYIRNNIFFNVDICGQEVSFL